MKMHLLKTGCQQMAGKEDKNEQSKHKEFSQVFCSPKSPIISCKNQKRH